MNGEERRLGHMGILRNGLEEAVEKNPLAGPSDMDDHDPGLGLGQDILAMDGHHLRCREGPVLEELAVILAAVNMVRIVREVLIERGVLVEGMGRAERVIKRVNPGFRNTGGPIFFKLPPKDRHLGRFGIVEIYGTGNGVVAQGFPYGRI